MPWVKCYKDARSTKEKEEEGQVRRSLVRRRRGRQEETGKGGERRGNGEGGQEKMDGLALLPCRHAFVLSANPESPLYSRESSTESGVQYQMLLHFKEFECLPSPV